MNRLKTKCRFCGLQIALLALVFTITSSHVRCFGAGFVKIDEISLPTNTGAGLCAGCSNHHGIAYVNNEWHIANPFSNNWRTYDNSFNLLRTTAIPGLSSVPGLSDLRGLAADPLSGNLFLTELPTGTIYEMTPAGSIVQQFSTSFGGLNAIAFDARDNTLWLLQSSFGTVEHRTRTGGLLSSFTTGVGWTGLALDVRNDSLLLLRDTDDLVDEYSTSGTFLGQPVATDQLPSNGQGLFYDPDLGRLYGTSQEGIVNVFSDPTRVPEPSTALLALCLLASASFQLTGRFRRA